MKNKVFVEEVLVLENIKIGREKKWKLENGKIISNKEFKSSKLKIECSECKNLIPINQFYNALNFRIYTCRKCISTGDKNSFYGKKHSEEFKNRLSKERSGVWYVGNKNRMYGINVWDTYTEEEKKEKRKKISNGQLGSKNQFYGKTHSDKVKKILSEKTKNYLVNHPDHIKKMTEASLNKQVKGFKSNIEKIVQEQLINRKIQFKYSKILHRKYQYDFIIENEILLEVHGDYWHANPLYYGENKIPLNSTQNFKVKLDEEKKNFAIKYGYKYFSIWESDIKKNNFSIIDCIEKEIRKVEKNEIQN